MMIKVIDSIINALTKLKNRFSHNTSIVDVKQTASNITHTQPILKRRGCPKLQSASPKAKKPKPSKMTTKFSKKAKPKTKSARNPQLTLKKVEQIEELIKDKRVTIAEACKTVGLSPSYFYKVKSKK